MEDPIGFEKMSGISSDERHLSCSSDNSTNSEGTLFPPARFRIGSVQFLNAVPLTWNLREIAASMNTEIDFSLDVPARLAEELVRGKLDAALIPLVEAIRHPELHHVSDVCISSDGNVGSIEFASLSPIEEVRRVGLDPASRTSNALIQICFSEYFRNTECEFVPFSVGAAMGLTGDETEKIDFSQPGMTEKLAEVCRENQMDGVLLIGDKALSLPHQIKYFSCVYDLGQVWTQWTGLPFVYASWFTASNTAEDWNRLSLIFNESRRASQVGMDVLTINESLRRKMEIRRCHDYLTRQVRYRLGGRERRGAEVFCKMTQKYGLVPLGASIEFEANRKRRNAMDASE